MTNKEFDIKEEYDFSDGKNIKEFENGKFFFKNRRNRNSNLFE